MSSIRRQLLGGLLGVVVLALLIAAGAVYLRARAELDELFDYQLRQMALSLRDRAFEQFVVVSPFDIQDDFDFVIQVWSNEGVRLYYSRPHAALPERAQLGFATISTPEGDWRVFGVQQRDVTIQVAQPMRMREEIAASAALRTLAPFLALLPILALLVWITVGRGLRPLEAVAGAVKARTPAALHPLPGQNLPEEVRPLVAALNDLLERLGRALETQRQFVADAAHELRTPLTALRLQIQLAERAQSDEERASAFASVKQGLERATHAVGQLLTLARQEPEAADRPFAPVEFAGLARAVIAQCAPLAEAKAIDLGMGRSETATISGDGEGLRVMLSNLVDNAIRYTPRGGRVDVSTLVADGKAVIEVVDNGPGIPPQDRERVFDRFYRHEESGDSGSGLGLAIVKKVAERHRAQVTLSDGPGSRGLAVRVVFPLTGNPV
jgi:two-component system, OmpR family, sensor kinase